jgi:transcription-repair coupling factor (superfamily II helicase)
MLKLLNSLLSKAQQEVFNFKDNLLLSNINNKFIDFLSILIATKNTNNNIIIIAQNSTEAKHIYNITKLLNIANCFYFESLVNNLYDNTIALKSTMANRLSTLVNIQNNKSNIVITTPLGFLNRTIPKEILNNSILTLTKGNKLSLSILTSYLIENNYKKVDTVIDIGTFCIRGDIIDINAFALENNLQSNAIRIELFDDIIEKIKLFDINNQRSIEEIDNIRIIPSSEVVINEDTISNFINNTKDNSNYNSILELLQNNIVSQGLEHYLPFFYKNPSVLIDYLPNAKLILLGEDNILHNQIKDINNEYASLKESKNIPIEPSKIALSIEEIDDILLKTPYIYTNNFDYIAEKNNSNIKAINFSVDDFNIIYSKYKHLSDDYINNFTKFIIETKFKAIIFLLDVDFKNNLIKALDNKKISYSNNLTDNVSIYLVDCPFNIQSGFIFNNFAFINQQDITGVIKTWIDDYKPKQINHEKFLQQLSTIAINDIIVHEKHGFGKYLGIKTLNIHNTEHDFLEILYKNNEKLYVPVENIDLISLYSSNDEEVALDNLSSNSFENKSKKVKEEIKDIAYDLIKISAQREIEKGLNININYNDYKKFSDSFGYVETADQQKAIDDIIADFTNNKISDRLVCGDVGFGKTEVAMRAAFLVAHSGYQVMVITPTTLLTEQHFNSFKERFKDFPITIAKLSRFTSKKDKKDLEINLENGEIDIIIGTHALLFDNIKFKNIGLVIIDEEQNFGVVHKEKLKTLRANTHLLTLSATPIPRTLQLSLKGVKDLSLITTPPVEKLPINTFVLQSNLVTIKQAIETEINRGGQVFFVCAKIADIKDLKDLISSLNLNIKYTVLHGQMPSSEIEQNMLDFANKKYDLLICTNIIESGLNLKNVNTIIIHQAYIFGLSQLYQLRGRVGRGNIKGYAYLLYNNINTLTAKAQKRLEILKSLDYLGASFALASYDLDMRGAGNLLGEKQSGHIKEIGYSLYQKLLTQEINYLKQNKNNVQLLNFSPNINLNAPVLIPKTYISNIEILMEIYQKIGAIEAINELDDIKIELMDRFGSIPYQTQNLLITIELKIKAKEVLIEKIIFGNKGVSLYFYNNICTYVDKLLEYIMQNSNILSIKPPSILFVNISNNNDADTIQKNTNQINAIKKILKDLSNFNK